MGTGLLTVDPTALAENWRALDRMTACETGAVVKADGYGLGAGVVARTLAQAGARRFFVAVAAEGAALRRVLGVGPEIFVFAGHMDGDAGVLRDAGLIPMLNSVEQLIRQVEALPRRPFGIQLDSGMNRLGMAAAEWAAIRDVALAERPVLVASHLACADEPANPMNAAQLETFRTMTDGVTAPLSLAATGGILLGPRYHFDLTRPGIGLYGGRPYAEARPVVRLSLPVIQIRDVAAGETVGYGGTWTAARPSRIATVSGGYADGLIRAMGGRARLFHGDVACPLAGRVSMDLLTVDVTDLDVEPGALDILGAAQGVDALADAAGTIGYEVLTSLGPRYARTEGPVG